MFANAWGDSHEASMKGLQNAIVGLERTRCITYIIRMFNLISWLIGLVCLVLGIPMLLPGVGLLLWLLLPVTAIGIGFGALSSSNSGRNFCILVFVLIVLRMAITGGTF